MDSKLAEVGQKR